MRIVPSRLSCKTRLKTLVACICGVILYTRSKEFKKSKKNQLIDKDNTSCTFWRNSVIVSVYVDHVALKRYFRSLSLRPIPVLIQDLLYNEAELFGKNIGFYPMGIHYAGSDKIEFSPLHIWICTSKTSDFFRNICWVLAHEIRHHYQEEKGMISYFFYDTSTRARAFWLKLRAAIGGWLCFGVLLFNICLLLNLPTWSLAALAIWTFYFVLLVSFYCCQYLPAIICEYQADRFAYREMNNPLLKQCVKIRYHSPC